MCEYRGAKLPCVMKVTVVGPSGALSAGHNPSGERSECEHTCWDPKGKLDVVFIVVVFSTTCFYITLLTYHLSLPLFLSRY